MIAAFWARFSYVNPGIPFLFEELAARESRGIRTVDVTTSTVQAVREIVGRASAIIIDQSLYNASTWVRGDRRSVYYVHDSRPRAFYVEILELLLAASSPKLFASYFDLHDKKNLTLISYLRGRIDAFSWMFEKKPPSVNVVPQRYRDAWLTDDYDPGAVWEEVVRSFPVRIELPFAIAQSELSTTPAAHRWDSSVAGAPYLTRVIARKAIREAGLSVAPARFAARSVEALMYLADPFLGVRRSSLLQIKLQQRTQSFLVRSTPTGFVCGGPLAFPVRKFFEIPALRSALVALPCVGFEDLGFRDGLNAIFTSPEDAGTTVRLLLHNGQLRARMSQEGFKLISTVHSVSRRVNDLISCMNRLIDGRIHNAQFVAGEFHIS